MSNHTPGPWGIWRRAEGAVFQGLEITGPGGTPVIADIRQNGHNAEHGEANARLIASAPDLLAALEEMRHWLGKVTDWSGAGDPPLEKLRDAIAKARGD